MVSHKPNKCILNLRRVCISKCSRVTRFHSSQRSRIHQRFLLRTSGYKKGIPRHQNHSLEQTYRILALIAKSPQNKASTL